MFLPTLLVILGRLLPLGGPPTTAEATILSAFDSAWVVALGEHHGHLEFHELVVRVLKEPNAPDIIDADSPVDWALIDSASQLEPCSGTSRWTLRFGNRADCRAIAAPTSQTSSDCHVPYTFTSETIQRTSP